MEAYCVKCKTKREIKDPQALFTNNGTPATRGTCPECGTTLFRMGKTEAHAGMTAPEPGANRKGKLVIVESPAKARTVGRFLGKGYTVKASIGHVRDLLRSQLSVDVEHDFEPKYRVPKEKTAVVKEIKALAKTHEEIYLATDPDREGEAISWHLMQAANIPLKYTKRVVFHEITEPAIAEAFGHPRDIDMALVDAQQARRVLDRLVGYSLSPLLWRKVRRRLSAGRVQSVALRLVVEREREIDAFVPEEYWTIEAEFRPQGLKETFIAKLAKVDAEDPKFSKEDEVKPVLADMEASAYTISKIKRGERRRTPSAPFITSTLQQEASRKLGYTARRTMALAQQLYEGIDLGDGSSRPDHLHAHRLDQRRRAGAGRSPPVHRRALRRRLFAQRAAQVSKPRLPGRRKRMRPSAPLLSSASPNRSRNSSTATSSGCTSSSGSALWPRR